MNGSYRTSDGQAQINWELKDRAHGPVFSAAGAYSGGYGQCIDSIVAAYPKDATVQAMHRIWREWHLNDMHAGTPEQETFLRRDREHFQNADYDTRLNWLRDADLLDVPITPYMRVMGGFAPVATTYRYGSRWLYQPIPADVLAEIRSWAALPSIQPLGEFRAEEFLKRNGLQFRAVRHPANPCPEWASESAHGHCYNVTISRDGGRPRLSFRFWGSYNDAQDGRSPSAYDVLSHMSMDAACPDTLEEFCSEYGFDPELRASEATFKRCGRFASWLTTFFTTQELQELSELT